MAERRMFAKTIIDSDAFLDMPLSTQALYFHLSMRADDDGFINNPKKIQRMVGATDDDLKLLVAKNFIIPFESGVVVIKHWKIHNYIRKERKHDTKYLEERSMLTVKENGAYTVMSDICQTDGVQDVRQLGDTWDTEVRLGKDSIGKDRLVDVVVESPAEKTATATMEIAAPICDLLPGMCDEILSVWNQQEVTQKINRLPIMSRRANNTRLCFRYVNTFGEFLAVIRTLDDQAWFRKRAEETGKKVSYDWFCDPNNFLKVIEGNYREDNASEKKKNKFTDFDQREYDDDFYAELEKKMMGG